MINPTLLKKNYLIYERSRYQILECEFRQISSSKMRSLLRYVILLRHSEARLRLNRSVASGNVTTIFEFMARRRKKWQMHRACSLQRSKGDFSCSGDNSHGERSA